MILNFNIKLKDANRILDLYIKSLGDSAVYRVEESVKMRSSLTDVLHTIRRPSGLQVPDVITIGLAAALVAYFCYQV